MYGQLFRTVMRRSTARVCVAKVIKVNSSVDVDFIANGVIAVRQLQRCEEDRSLKPVGVSLLVHPALYEVRRDACGPKR